MSLTSMPTRERRFVKQTHSQTIGICSCYSKRDVPNPRWLADPAAKEELRCDFCAEGSANPSNRSGVGNNSPAKKCPATSAFVKLLPPWRRIVWPPDS